MFRFCTSHAYYLLHEAHHFQRGYSDKSTNQPVTTTYHTFTSPRNRCINLTKRFPLPSCHSTPCCSPLPGMGSPTNQHSSIPCTGGSLQKDDGQSSCLEHQRAATTENHTIGTVGTGPRAHPLGVWRDVCTAASFTLFRSSQKRQRERKKAATARCSRCMTSGRSLPLVAVP